tara:strand:+ start:61 stop:1698 length:1638 start_codon:yes stop_codon:yes gene_type:complete
MDAHDVKTLLIDHERYWEYQRHDMEKYKAIYETRFWDDRQDDPTAIVIQTQDCYSYVESYLAGLYAKNPAIVLKAGLRGLGDPDKSSAVVNEFLTKCRQQIEEASRMALIYPNAFFKIIPVGGEDVYDMLLPVALPPWEVIVDRDASRHDQQRYIGHVYYCPLHMAKERFGAKKFDTVSRERYFKFTTDRLPEEEEKMRDTEFDKYIKVVEIYDLVNNRLQFWTPNWGEGKKFLTDDPIPFRDYADRPSVPIVPFYFSSMPDQPMIGYSAVRRIYDQCYEKNVVRSFQAGAVRKASRQYLVRKGIMDEEQMAQLTSGIDGLFIEVDDEDLDAVIRPIPHTMVPVEVGAYAQTVTQDKDAADQLAPFARGEAMKSATATEVAALASYSSSQLGQMARKRDAAIEQLSRVYLNILGLFLEDEKALSVLIDGVPEIVKPSDVIGDFDVFAADMATTPMSEQLAKQQLLENIPTLLQLGVPQPEILKEVVRMLGLPESFIPVVPTEMAPPGGMPGAMNAGTQMPLQDVLADPGPANVAQYLPQMNDAVI